MNTWNGSNWGSEVWSINQVHSASKPFKFTVTFNPYNGFIINYQGNNIAIFPNRFNIINADDFKLDAPNGGINIF